MSDLLEQEGAGTAQDPAASGDSGQGTGQQPSAGGLTAEQVEEIVSRKLQSDKDRRIAKLEGEIQALKGGGAAQPAAQDAPREPAGPGDSGSVYAKVIEELSAAGISTNDSDFVELVRKTPADQLLTEARGYALKKKAAPQPQPTPAAAVGAPAPAAGSGQADGALVDRIIELQNTGKAETPEYKKLVSEARERGLWAA